MNLSETRRRLKPWILPIAMLSGILLHDYIGDVAFLSRYLIFILLLITYCKVSVRNFRPVRATWIELFIQFAFAVAAYYAVRPCSELIAQGVFICIYCPTATAAPVVTGMLGGSVERVATYSLISHLIVALTAPLLLGMMNPEVATIGFSVVALQIAYSVLPLILGPMIIAFALQAWAPRAHHAIASHQGLAFYIWAIALILVVGNAVSFIMHEPSAMIPTIIALGLLALILCIMQFAVGRQIGRRYGDPTASAQSLGQKNTILAIWLVSTFLNPVVSVAPAAYIMWHNTYNAWQIYRHEKDQSSTHNREE